MRMRQENHTWAEISQSHMRPQNLTTQHFLNPLNPLTVIYYIGLGPYFETSLTNIGVYYNKLYAVKKIQRFDFESESDSEYVNLAQPDTTKNPNRGFVLTWNIIYIHSSVTHSLLISLSVRDQQVCTFVVCSLLSLYLALDHCFFVFSSKLCYSL